MCGICGVAYGDQARPVDPGVLDRMMDPILHRGPDGFGTRIDGPVGLAHRRLSIIDVAGGMQPLSNEDGSVWVSFNGEIYNYPELTRDLVARGHTFHTRSDTEVLVHGYEEEGAGYVRRLNGMFAYALHDVRQRKVILARDHFGIKPLFYAITRDGLIFGSEIKAVIAGLGYVPKLRINSLREYLMFRFVAGDQTFFEGIHRLPPGCVATWDGRRLDIQHYWDPPPVASAGPSHDDAADQLEALLDRSVVSQLMSEVPLGAFLSGGLDSGVVSWFASRHTPFKLHSYSVGFQETRWDESPLALETAAVCGTEHRPYRMEVSNFFDALPLAVWHHDEPLSHPNCVPFLHLSRFARTEVTVALTGEGSDEIFAGYPRYMIARFSGALDRLPAAARSSVAAAATLAPQHKLQRLATLLPYRGGDSIIFNSVYLDESTVQRLTRGAVDDALQVRRDLLKRVAVQGDAIASISRYELLTYLPCLLDRMDRMTMSASLEGRVPFLDVPLAEWALGLPSRYKLSGLTTKRVVRDVARKHLGKAVLNAPKSGFGLPLSRWFNSPQGEAHLARLQDARHPAAEFIDVAEVKRIVADHRSGLDRGDALWLLTNFWLWMDVFQTGKALKPSGAAPGGTAAARADEPRSLAQVPG